MLKLTARQQQILEFVREFTRTEGYPPTRAEIARALGFRSANAAEDHLKALARKGVVELQPGASRAIRIIEERHDDTLPVIGRVAAGSPILAAPHVQARYRLDPDLFKPRPDYLLEVKGTSMREAGILDGDLLAVHHRPEARTGEIVVARVEDEVTVKRFRRRGHVVRLLPENPDYSPIVVDLRETTLVIEGVGVGVIRNRRP